MNVIFILLAMMSLIISASFMIPYYPQRRRAEREARAKKLDPLAHALEEAARRRR